MQNPRSIRSTLAIAALVAFTLAGCGDDDSGATAAGGNGSGDPGATSASGGVGEQAGDAPADWPSGPDDAMTAEDGWVPLHDFALPDPGTAVVTIDGAEYVIDIECFGPGIRPEGQNQISLFRIAVEGEFQAVDGRQASISISRGVTTYEQWTATGGAGDVYQYPGQDSASVSILVEVELADGGRGWHNSHRTAPADHDRTGEHMPLVHVSPDGGFTVDTEVVPLMASVHTDALVGAVQVAGQCDGPWEDQPT